MHQLYSKQTNGTINLNYYLVIARWFDGGQSWNIPWDGRQQNGGETSQIEQKNLISAPI